MGPVIRLLAILLVAGGSLSAQSSASSLFWEPELPSPQSFFTTWRAIKAYSLTRYEIVQDKERYPATELSVELTHGVVHFFHLGPSAGGNEPLSLREIADGKFADGNRLERFVPGKEPPEELLAQKREPLRYVRFCMKTAEEVENLHRQIHQHFKSNFPW